MRDLETLTYVEHGLVAEVTLARPAVRNAISPVMIDELTRVFRDLHERDDIRVVVLAGSDDAFCAGADLRSQGELVAGKTPLEMIAVLRRTHEAFDTIANLPQPTVAAISGPALGGGLELALACDLRVASPSARLGLPEARVGAMPAGGGTQRLARLIGASRAADLMLTCEVIDAQAALAMGLVNRVAPDWLDTARELAARMAGHSPAALRLIKETLWRGLDASLSSGLTQEIYAVSLLFSGDDRAEGARAFLEKRPPEFRGS